MAGLALPKKRLNETLFSIRCEADTMLLIREKDIDVLLSKGFIAFIEGLQIITKAEGIKPLIWNLTQEELWHWFLMKREARLAIRGICCKSRQQGISTFWTAINFADITLRANRFAFMASHEAVSTNSIFGKARTFYKLFPKAWKDEHPLERFTRWEMIYEAPHNSQFRCGTANNEGLASGTTIHDLHLSEPAKYKNPPANDAITSVLGCVPDHFDTWIFWESTAKGAWNLFHHWWNAAELGPGHEGWNGYDALFFSPRGFKEYYFYFTDDDPKIIPENAVVIKRPKLTSEEATFQKERGICDHQMAWWVDKLRNKYRGDWGETLQELPWRASDAFKFTGNPWFNMAALAELKEQCCAPKWTGRLEWINDEDPLVEWVDDPNGIIEVWEKPEKDRPYFVGSDCGEGVGADYTVSFVGTPAMAIGEIDRIVARYVTNRMKQHDAAILGFQLGIYYNRAFTGVGKLKGGAYLDVLERGAANVPQMKEGYPNLYYHVHMDRRTEVQTQKLGFLENKPNKRIMLMKLQAVVDDKSIYIPSKDTIIQMEGFLWDNKLQDWVQQNVDPKTKLPHDDHITASAILEQMIIHGRESISLGQLRDGSW